MIEGMTARIRRHPFSAISDANSSRTCAKAMTELPDFPGWTFEIDEVSAGVSRAAAFDRAGRRVEASGVDAEALLERCKQWALEVESSCRTWERFRQVNEY
jgi:hypothetical protein